MPKKKRLRVRLESCKHFRWHTVVFFLGNSVISGIAVLSTVLMVLLNAELFEFTVIQPVIIFSMLTILVWLILSFLIFLVYSNKISGPIQRLQKYLAEILDGDISKPINFRSDDEFRELADAINRFRESIVEMKSSKHKK